MRRAHVYPAGSHRRVFTRSFLTQHARDFTQLRARQSSLWNNRKSPVAVTNYARDQGALALPRDAPGLITHGDDTANCVRSFLGAGLPLVRGRAIAQ